MNRGVPPGRSRGTQDRGGLGQPHIHYRITGSTNDRARALALAGAPHGTTVTAEEQTSGRGRQGRSWHAPAGRALLASVVIRALGEGDALLPLAAAVAVCEACEEVAAVSCQIKWPNDVMVEDRKVAGILIEGRPQDGWAVVGAGVNVATTLAEFPPELRGEATSLALAAGGGAQAGAPDVSSLFNALLRRLCDRLDDPPGRVLEAWRRRDALLGREISWADGAGTAAGIDEWGSLLVRTPEGTLALDSGEVHLGSGAPGGSSRAGG